MFKKIAILIGLASSSLFCHAQGAKFGLHTAPLISFMGSNDPRIKSAGAAGGLNVGLELEYYFMESEKVALTFGVDFSLAKGGKMLYKYGGRFFPESDQNGKFDGAAFTSHSSLGSFSPSESYLDSTGLDFAAFSVIRQTVNYVEIPFALKLRPAEFGDWKIFVHVPMVRLMVPVSARARIMAPDSEQEDFVDDFLGFRVAEDEHTKASVYKDIFPFQVSVGLGAGAEWAPSDKLRVYAGIYYDASLLNITKPKAIMSRAPAADLLEAAVIAADVANNGYNEKTVRMAPHTLSLRIGVLFVP